MSTINPQIDEAVVLMKARAAEFDDDCEMDDEDFHSLVDRADRNLTRAIKTARWHGISDGYSQALIHRDLLDTMNLCTLALSVMPKGGS